MLKKTAITLIIKLSIYEFEEKITKIIQNYPFLVAENKINLGYAYAVVNLNSKDAYK